jgi:hypothetical protein
MDTQAAAREPVVETDVLCVGCDYNLRMQPVGGVCPECGRPVQATLKFPRLARSAPRWLTSLVDSVTLLLVALGFSIACAWTDRGRDETTPIVLGTTAWALSWFAVWLLTRPEPGGRSRKGRVRAWVLRVFATIPYFAVFAGPRVARELDLWLGMLLIGASLLCVLPATFMYYDHLRRAARRLPNKRLAWQAAAVSWLLPPAVLVSMVSLFVLDRQPRSVGQALTMLPMVGLGGIYDTAFLYQIVVARAQLLHPLPLSIAPATVMTAWAVAVLVQFRVAFAAAVRAARGGSAAAAGQAASASTTAPTAGG